MAETNEFFSGFVVVLKDDVDNEKMLKIQDTILMIKDIVDVKPIGREKVEQRIQKSRIKDEIMRTIVDAVSKI
jgi:Na+-transporting NADH:ubiquinone oxidoreductase subunit NqrC